MTIVTLPHRPTTDPDDRPVVAGPEADGPRPTAPARPTWAYGAGAVRRAVAELWQPHVAPGELDRLAGLAAERDRGLDDVY